MMKKIVKLLGYVILGVTGLIGLLFFLQDAPVLQAELDAIHDMPQELKPAEITKIAGDWTGVIYNWALILFIGSAVIAVLFAIFKFVTDTINEPKSAIKPAISIVVIALIVIISYSLSTDKIPVFLGSQNFDITPTTSRNVETFLYTMYILFGVTALGAIYSEVSRIWK